MDREISSYMNPVQPMAAPVMICIANQEESDGRFAKAE
jgi:hypothetical protein